MEFIPLPHVTPATAVVLRQTVDGCSAVAALEGEGGYWLPDTVSCVSEGDRSCPQQLSPGLGLWCHRLQFRGSAWKLTSVSTSLPLLY